MEQKKNDSRNAAQGCVLGAFIGDACGAYLEFVRNVTEADVSKALTFPGGGCWKTSPGQITDDSEMAMCILHGLCDSKYRSPENFSSTELPLNLDGIGRYFSLWSMSAFDIGNTTNNSFQRIDEDLLDKPTFYENTPRIIQQVQKVNIKSQSNGCLMRITPLAIWAHKLGKEDLYHAVRLQTNLTHSHDVPLVTCYLYCFAIQQLIQKPGDAKNAYDETKAEALIRDKEEGTNISSWFNEIEKGVFPPPTTSMGNLKIAFTHTFSHLREFPNFIKKYQKSDYYGYVLEKVLLLGGDTDTNAAIVGGLIGALVGESGIPQDWINKLLKFESPKKGYGVHNRPDFLIPKLSLEKHLENVYTNAPTELKVQYCNVVIDDKETIQNFSRQPLKMDDFLEKYLESKENKKQQLKPMKKDQKKEKKDVSDEDNNKKEQKNSGCFNFKAKKPE